MAPPQIEQQLGVALRILLTWLVFQGFLPVRIELTHYALGNGDWMFIRMTWSVELQCKQEEAQDKLDEAMRSNDVAWLNMSVSGIERLVLEAITFGRVLWDVERTFDIEYSLVSE